MRTERTTPLTEPRRGIDMSAAAIHQRLEDVQQLYELGTYLAAAKPVFPPGPKKRDPSQRDER